MCNNSIRWEGLFNNERSVERSSGRCGNNNSRCCNQCCNRCCGCGCDDEATTLPLLNNAVFAAEYPVYVSVPLFLRGEESESENGCGCGCGCGCR